MSAQRDLWIKTFIKLSTCNQSICNVNNSTGFYIIQDSFAKGILEQTLVKVQDGAMKFVVIRLLEYYAKFLKIIHEEVHL